MKPQCIASVNAAAGRHLSDAEIAKIEGALNGTAKRLARLDNERWRSLSADQRTIEAGIQAVKDLQAEASLKKFRSVMQIVKTADTEARIATQERLFRGGRSNAVVRDMQNVANDAAGIREEAMSGMFDLIEAAKDKGGAGLGRKALMAIFDAENPAMTRDLAHEIYGKADGSTGNPMAKAGAQAWLKTIEPMRQRMNGAGGDIGKLDTGYLPNTHDAMKTLKAGQETWVEKKLPQLDRKQYVNADGSMMSDGQVRDFLGEAWETITTEGQNKAKPGAFKGTGARANKGSQSRQIHFKDAEAWLEHQAEFGRGSMYEAIVSHVGGMSRDTALIEKYGPNPETQMRLQFDLAARAEKRQPDDLPRTFGITPQGYWSVLSGAAGVPQNALIARVGENLRASQTAGKLQQAVVSSISDVPTYFMTTGYNRLSYWQAIANYGRAMTADTKEFMAMHGIIAESARGDLNRFSGDHLTGSIAGRIAQATMKVSLLNAWTDTLRNAFQLTMMNGLARMSKKGWNELAGFDRARMEAHGVTEADWGVITQAALTEHKGLDFLTPEAIRASGHADAAQVVSKVLGLIKDEGEFAVINPDLATKALQTGGGTQAGTGKGELFRSMMQFKSFPIAMISRHWRRMLDTAKLDSEGRPIAANPAVYGALLAVSLTALGAIALQAKQITASKDPIDMQGEHAAKFWLQAFVQGGGASILGDMFLKDTTQGGGGFASASAGAVLGPTAGTMMDGFGTLKDNIDRHLKGLKTHTGADMVRVGRTMMPFVNLWYTKAIVDHLGLHAIQESLSPGYLARMRQRAQKDWGQDFWWKPGSGGAQRAPDLAKAVGP